MSSVVAAVDELVLGARRTDWSGADPYDALVFPWPRPLVAGRRRRQALIQLHARAPVDLRRAYRRTHPRNPKALALFAGAVQRSFTVEPTPWKRDCLEELLDLLLADGSSGGPGWGYPFDVQTRWSFYARDTPNIIATAFAGLALEEGGRLLEDQRYVDRAQAAARWTLDELFVEDGGFFGYHPGSEVLVHNASLLGAQLVRRLTVPGGDAAISSVVRATLEAQDADGSWPYGSGPGLEFVDSFHTGFVLQSLLELGEGDDECHEAIRAGAGYYEDRFFGPRGEAKLWPDRAFPLDAHSAGTGLSTLAQLAKRGFVGTELVGRVAEWTLANLVDGGRVVHRINARHRNSVHYIRWSAGHVALGLANAATLSP